MSTERPIPFSAPMVRAVLAGTKTQTRRIIKPVGRDGGFVLVEEDDGTYWPRRSDDGESIMVTVREKGRDYLHEIPMSCPYGQPGDRLWVREAWRTTSAWDRTPPRNLPGRVDLHYEADGQPNAHFCFGKLRPAMFMVRGASRITLEVTGVRVEPLQGISEADALAEGITHSTLNDPRVEYRWLWEQINGPGSWDANPWVWCVEFRLVK